MTETKTNRAMQDDNEWLACSSCYNVSFVLCGKWRRANTIRTSSRDLRGSGLYVLEKGHAYTHVPVHSARWSQSWTLCSDYTVIMHYSNAICVLVEWKGSRVLHVIKVSIYIANICKHELAGLISEIRQYRVKYSRNLRHAG